MMFLSFPQFIVRIDLMFLSFPQFIVRIDQSAEKGAVKEKPVFLIILPCSSLCIISLQGFLSPEGFNAWLCSLLYILRLYSENAWRCSLLYILRLYSEHAECVTACVSCSISEHLLDADQLVVLGKPVRAAHGTGLYLTGLESDYKVRNRAVLSLTGAV